MDPPDPRPSRAQELVELTVVAGLMLGAGLALFALSWSGCSDSGSICGSGFLTLGGVGLELALLTAAIALAAWRALGQSARRGNHGSNAEGPA
jgi:hypothetical protein